MEEERVNFYFVDLNKSNSTENDTFVGMGTVKDELYKKHIDAFGIESVAVPISSVENLDKVLTKLGFDYTVKNRFYLARGTWLSPEWHDHRITNIFIAVTATKGSNLLLKITATFHGDGNENSKEYFNWDTMYEGIVVTYFDLLNLLVLIFSEQILNLKE